MAVWQCTSNFYAQPKFLESTQVIMETRVHNGIDMSTHRSCTGRQRTIGYVGTGEVWDHKKWIARIVGTLEKATILMPSQCCGH